MGGNGFLAFEPMIQLCVRSANQIGGTYQLKTEISIRLQNNVSMRGFMNLVEALDWIARIGFLVGSVSFTLLKMVQSMQRWP